MTYEEALQIAMEELYDAVEVLRRNNKGYPSRVDLECNRLLTARNVLCKALEEAEEKYATKVVAMHEDGTYTAELIPLPKREWVGLTQEELQDLCVKSYHTDNAGETHFGRGYFADAIEAKLKEKNHD